MLRTVNGDGDVDETSMPIGELVFADAGADADIRGQRSGGRRRREDVSWFGDEGGRTG